MSLRTSRPDAAGAHQLQAGVRGHQGVLRVLAALAVQGPDEPASEITHKRRLRRSAAVRASALGSRSHVHPILRPRLPDQTPAEHRPHRLARRTRVNDFGFVRPRTASEGGRVSDEGLYLSALEGGAPRSRRRTRARRQDNFTADLVSSRIGGEFTMVRPAAIEFMDVSPNQPFIGGTDPFLEERRREPRAHGLNMQRSGARYAPRRRSSAPAWKGGRRDSGVTIAGPERRGRAGRRRAHRRQGRPPNPDAAIRRRHLQPGQVPALNRTPDQPAPIVVVDDRVMAGDVIADGRRPTWASSPSAATCSSRSCRAWLNFEDSILISSGSCARPLHLDPHRGVRGVARDTKLGPEEITMT